MGGQAFLETVDGEKRIFYQETPESARRLLLRSGIRIRENVHELYFIRHEYPNCGGRIEREFLSICPANDWPCTTKNLVREYPPEGATYEIPFRFGDHYLVRAELVTVGHTAMPDGGQGEHWAQFILRDRNQLRGIFGGIPRDQRLPNDQGSYHAVEHKNSRSFCPGFRIVAMNRPITVTHVSALTIDFNHDGAPVACYLGKVLWREGWQNQA